jgi:hypothetical protein
MTTHPVTIVSCYYHIPGNTKRSPDQYKLWITHFLTFCKTPIVMFSDGPEADEIDAIRKSTQTNNQNPWLLIRKPINTLSYTSKEDIKFWNWCYSVDPCQQVHTTDMFIFWANKSQFVKETILQNPFQSTHFFWCDAGCWRNQPFALTYAPQWPSLEKLPNQILLTWIKNYEGLQTLTSDFRTLEDYVHCEAFRGQCTAAGAIFGGPATAMILFADAYTNLLRLYQNNKKFGGDDQALLASIGLYLERKGLVKNIPCYTAPTDIQGADNWFALQYLLAP